MRHGGQANRPGMALTTTVILVAFLFWLALPARADARITLLPTSGPPGTLVTVVGDGFGANEVVSVCWGDVRCANSGRPVANSLGTFTAFFAVPEDSADYVVGENTVGACGRSTGDCAQTVFTVITGSTTLPPTTTTTTPTTTAPVDPTTTTTVTENSTTTITENPTTTTTTEPGDSTSTLPGSPGTTVPPPPGSSTGPAVQPGSPDDADPPGTASDPADTTGTADPADTTVESEPASSLQPAPASSVPPVTPPSLPPPEVLTRSLQSPGPLGEADELLAPSSQTRSTYAVSAAGDSDVPAGLSQIQWILLWFGTMVVFTIGVMIYDMRRRWRSGRR